MELIKIHQKSLYKACFGGQSDVVKRILDNTHDNVRGKLVMAQEEPGQTALFGACLGGHLDIVKMILESVTDEERCVLVKVQTESGRTALYEACVANRSDIVQSILTRVNDSVRGKVVMTQTEDHGRTCLYQACLAKNNDVVKTIMENISDDVRNKLLKLQTKSGRTAFYAACISEQNNIVKTILDVVSDDMRNELVMTQIANGRTNLYEACITENNDIVKTILESVCDGVRKQLLMVQEEDGHTCLYEACSSAQGDIVKTILESVSDDVNNELVMMQTHTGRTCLYIASFHDHSEIVGLVLDNVPGRRDQLVMVREDDGRTCLYEACSANHMAIIETIHEKVSSGTWSRLVKVQDNGGYTALHVACRCGCSDAVRFIFETSKDDSRDELMMAHSLTGDTHLHIPCERGHSDIVSTILDNISNEDREALAMTENAQGHTALYSACSSGNTGTVRVFLDHFTDTMKRKLTTHEQTAGGSIIEVTRKNEHYETLASLCALIPGTLYKYITKDVMTNACQRGLKDEISSILHCVSNFDTTNFRMLLQSLDDDGRSLLHIACSRGDNCLVEVIVGFVTHLTDKSEFICTKDQYGKTALHECCQQGSYQLVQTLIDAARKWHCVSDMFSTEDSQQKTPLWYAFEMGQYNIVKTIVDQASVANCVTELLLARDSERQTLVHKSCQNSYRHITCVEKIMKLAETQTENVKIDLLCARDAYGKTFLSYICEANQFVVKYLIQCLTDWELRILECPTIMSDIAQKEFVELCELLNSNSICRWFLTNVDNEGNTILHGTNASHAGILCHMLTPFHDKIQMWCTRENDNSNADNPMAVVETRLDRKGNDSSNSVTNWDKFPENKGIIEETKKTFEKNTTNHVDTHIDNNSKFLRYGKPCYFHLLHNKDPAEFYNAKVQRNPLKAIGDSGCLELIRHPYTQAYLDVCWTSFVRYFFFTDLILYFLQLLCLTVFTSSYQYQLNQANSSMPVIIASRQYQLTNIFQYLLATFSLLVFSNEALQMLAMGKYYWRELNNYADLFICFGCFIMSVTAMTTTFHQFGILIMCTAWINFTWMLTKLTAGIFRPLGLLLIMLFNVIKKIVAFLPVLAIFILTASLSYTALLHSQEPFSHLGYSALKAIVMTTGELDFSSIFFPEDAADDPPFYILTCLLFVVFLGVMNIAVMNLLIGMAVSDIHKLETSESEVIAFRSRVALAMECQLMLQLFERMSRCAKSKNDP